MRIIRAACMLFITAIAFGGCSSDGGPTDGGGDPTIAIVLSGATLSIEQGDNGAVTATLTRGGGYNGAVTLVVEGAPSGITATATPASLTGSTLTSQIGFDVDPTVATGTYNLTIRATGSGVNPSTAPLSLTVSAGPAGSFTLAVQPATVPVTQGASVQAQVTVNRTNFPGEVTFSTGALPAGMSATFAPPSTSLLSSQLTLTAGPTTPAGAHSVEIRGDAEDHGTQTVALQVTVNAATGGGNVEWQFCGLTGIPVWVAYRDGNGPWTRVQPGADNRYTFSLNTVRGAIAYVTVENGLAELFVQHGLTAELTELGTTVCGETSVTKTISGSVAGLGPTASASVAMGSAFAQLLPGSNQFTLEDVLDGPRDLIATRIITDISGEDFSVMPDKLIIRRNLNPAPGAVLPVLDFGSAEAFDPVTRNLTVNNAGSDLVATVTGYFTANGASTAFFSALPEAGTAFTWAGVPTVQQAPGDLHWLLVTAIDMNDQTSARSAQQIFTEATDRTLTLGPEPGPVTVEEIEGAPYVRLTTTFTPQTEYNRFWQASYGQSSRGATVSVTSLFASGGSIDLSIPDFTGTDGWDPAAWALQPGTPTDWFFTAAGWTANGGVIFTPFIEGGEMLTATTFGQITP